MSPTEYPILRQTHTHVCIHACTNTHTSMHVHTHMHTHAHTHTLTPHKCSTTCHVHTCTCYAIANALQSNPSSIISSHCMVDSMHEVCARPSTELNHHTQAAANVWLQCILRQLGKLYVMQFRQTKVGAILTGFTSCYVTI